MIFNCLRDGRGCPGVLLVLDQTSGAEAQAQEEVFDRLQARFGDACLLVSADELPGVDRSHRAAGPSLPGSTLD